MTKLFKTTPRLDNDIRFGVYKYERNKTMTDMRELWDSNGNLTPDLTAAERAYLNKLIDLFLNFIAAEIIKSYDEFAEREDKREG